jgi:hypothetical protein
MPNLNFELELFNYTKKVPVARPLILARNPGFHNPPPTVNNNPIYVQRL